jgi:hypothetical protein
MSFLFASPQVIYPYRSDLCEKLTLEYLMLGPLYANAKNALIMNFRRKYIKSERQRLHKLFSYLLTQYDIGQADVG